MRTAFPPRLTAAVLTALLPTGAFCFQFDAWRSGMKEEKVLEVAREHDVSMSGGSLIGNLFSGKKAEEQPDTVEHRGEMKLLGYDAKLLFVFTPDTKLLHTVKVDLSVPMSGKEVDVDVLANAIAKQLDKKYKEGTVPTSGKLMDYFTDKLKGLKKRAWEDAHDLIVMESDWGMLGGRVSVVYSDKKLGDKARAEDVRIREKRLEKVGGKDKEKF